MITRKHLLLMTLTLTCVSALPQQDTNDFTTTPPDENLIISLLMDIKDILTSGSLINNPQLTNQNQLNLDEIQRDVKDIDKDVKLKVDNLHNSFEKLSEKNNQNLELVMQSFSALKILVTVQSEQIKHLIGRVETMELNIKTLEKKDFQGEESATSFTVDTAVPAVVDNDLDLEFPTNSATVRPETVSQQDIDKIKDSVTSAVIKELGQQIDHKIKDTNSSIHSIRTDISQLMRNVRNMKNDISTIQEKSAKTQDIQKLVPSMEMQENCLCSFVRQSFTRLSEATEEQKLMSLELKKKIDFIEQFKNDTVPEKYSSALVVARLSHLEKQMETIPELETTMNQLKNITLDISTSDSSTNHTDDKPDPLCVWPYNAGGNGCFYIHTKDRFTWEESRDYCKDIQGDLASPLHFDKFRQYLIGKRLSRSYNLWIGATDEGKESSWEWLDGRTVEESNKIWSSGRPNHNSRSNCMELKPTFRFVGSDEDCRSLRQFVCEQRRIKFQ